MSQEHTCYVRPGETVNTIRRQLRLSPDLAARISAEADAQRISDNEMVLRLIAQALDIPYSSK